MATNFKNVLHENLGTTPTIPLTTTAGVKTTIVGLSLTNKTTTVVLISLLLEDTVELTQAYYAKDIVVPPNQSLRLVTGGERLVVGPNTNIVLSSSVDDSIDVVISLVEIS